LAGRAQAGLAERQRAVTSISLAVLGAVATVSAELWRVLQETAGLQSLAARVWGSNPPMGALRALVLPALGRVGLAVTASLALAEPAAPVS
jgi:hypothetical protein